MSSCSLKWTWSQFELHFNFKCFQCLCTVFPTFNLKCQMSSTRNTIVRYTKLTMLCYLNKARAIHAFVSLIEYTCTGQVLLPTTFLSSFVINSNKQFLVFVTFSLGEYLIFSI